MTYRSSKLVHLCVPGVSRRIKLKTLKKVYLRNHNTCFFPCSPRPPTLSQRHVDLHVWAYPRTNYYIFQVSSKSVQGFRNPRGSKFGLSHYFASRVYNSLYYRTSHDYRGIPPLWCLWRLCVVLHYLFLNSTTREQTFNRPFCVQKLLQTDADSSKCA